MELRQSLFNEVNALLDNEELTRAAIRALQKLRKELQTAQREKEKQTMLADLTEAFRELKSMQEGKLQARPVGDLLKELEEENLEEEGDGKIPAKALLYEKKYIPLPKS